SVTVFTIQNRCSYIIWLQHTPALSSPTAALHCRPGALFNSKPCWAGRAISGSGSAVSSTTLATTTARPAIAPASSRFLRCEPGRRIQRRRRSANDGGFGDCRYATCAGNVISSCPKELQLVDGGGGAVVACKSACVAFHMPEYCCNGDHSSLETCGATAYSLLFKGLCLSTYSYAYDDRSSTLTCSGSDYSITFCVN
ncbi:hypothetical protein MIMGU_mgv1a022185mg, partial [Erythranthe guttata]